MATDTLTLNELLEKTATKLRFAQEDGAMLDAEKTYTAFMEDLQRLAFSSAPADTVYTTEEVARRLKVTAQTVTEYCRAGRFQAPPQATFASAYRTSGDSGPWRVPASAVMYFIKQQSEPNPVTGNEPDAFADLAPFLRAG